MGINKARCTVHAPKSEQKTQNKQKTIMDNLTNINISLNSVRRTRDAAGQESGDEMETGLTINNKDQGLTDLEIQIQSPKTNWKVKRNLIYLYRVYRYFTEEQNYSCLFYANPNLKLQFVVYLHVHQHHCQMLQT